MFLTLFYFQDNCGYQPLDARLKRKVESVVSDLYVTDTKHVMAHIEDWVLGSLFKGVTPPARTNQRFFPSPKTLKNAIDAVLSDNL